MSDLFADDRWYGPRYSESIGDTLHIVAGRILRDLTTDRAEGLMPANSAIVVWVSGQTITVNVFVSPAASDAEELDRRQLLARIKVIAARYDWRSKTNDEDRRFRLRIEVKPARVSLHGLIDGALLG